MKYLFLLVVLLTGCQCGGKRDQAALDKLQEQVSLNHTATKEQQIVFHTTAFTKNDSYFYEKRLTFTLTDSTLVVGGGQCEITYKANAPIERGDVIRFYGYTTFNQWFSDEFIQRITVTIDPALGCVEINNVKFYTLVPAKSNKVQAEHKLEVTEVESHYIVQPGDTYSKLSEKFGVPVEKLKELNGKTLKRGTKLILK